MPLSHRPMWHRPILSLVVDRATCLLPVAKAVREAVSGGVDWVQIRERELESGELLAWSESLARIRATPQGFMNGSTKLDGRSKWNIFTPHLGVPFSAEVGALGPGRSEEGSKWWTTRGFSRQVRS